MLQGESIANLLPPVPTPITPTATASSSLSQAFRSMTVAAHQTPENAGIGSRFSFSSVTDKLASQTHSIGKRIQQEWEQLAHHQQQHSIDLDHTRNYDDPPPRPAWGNNADPYVAAVPSAATQQQQTTTSPSNSPRRLLGAFGVSVQQQLSQQMQNPLAVLLNPRKYNYSC